MNVNIYNKNNEAEAIDESIFEESLKRKSYRWSGGVIVKAQKDVTVYPPGCGVYCYPVFKIYKPAHGNTATPV